MTTTKLFSIVIPAFNEERYIRDCLSSVENLNFPKENFEVIVVDNGSSDKTVGYAALFDVKILSILNVKVGDVRNFGAHHATGKYLVFLDSDCVVDSNWLNIALKRLEEHENITLGGQYLMRDNPSWLEKYWVLNNSRYHIYQTTLVGGCIFIKKSVFDELGGFNGKLHSGEDSDLTNRLIKAGYDVEIFPQLSVIHLGYPSEILPFIKRQLWHSADYITNFKKSIKDKIFIITLIFAISFFSLIFNIAIFNQNLIALSLIGLLGAPAILSYKRLSRSKTAYNTIIDICCIYLVDFLYLIGRFAGTMISLKNFIFKRSDKKISR